MNPKISIGMPVYNGERFIRNALDSLLSQTFRDFELIISDNASTDSTSSICQEYARKDTRIHYIRQSKNMGPVWNFNFVIQSADCKYFMFAAVDDFWQSTFIEKNIKILESDETIVGSIGDVELYREFTEDFKPDISDPLNRNKKKFQYAHPTFGPLEKRVSVYLRSFQASIIYGVYRTEAIKKSLIPGNFVANDLAVILSNLRYGNLHVVDEVLMHRYVQDRPSRSLIGYYFKTKMPTSNIIFLEFPFTFWFLKNFGLKLFIKNLHLFLKLILRGEYIVLADLIRYSKRIIFRQDRSWWTGARTA